MQTGPSLVHLFLGQETSLTLTKSSYAGDRKPAKHGSGYQLHYQHEQFVAPARNHEQLPAIETGQGLIYDELRGHPHPAGNGTSIHAQRVVKFRKSEARAQGLNLDRRQPRRELDGQTFGETINPGLGRTVTHVLWRLSKSRYR